MTVQELSDEMRKQKARCDQYCGTWNSEDRDCEVYGINHPSPSRCPLFYQKTKAIVKKEQEHD